MNVIYDSGTHKIESAGVAGQSTPLPKLTRIKFKQRMTQAERIAIRNAAKTDDIIFDFMDLVSEATYIDLSLPETIGGVQYLESQGHLAAGRADEILNTPITQEEAYQ